MYCTLKANPDVLRAIKGRDILPVIEMGRLRIFCVIIQRHLLDQIIWNLLIFKLYHEIIVRILLEMVIRPLLVKVFSNELTE